MSNDIYNLVMILNDGTEVSIVEGGINQHFVKICNSSAEFKNVWDMFTDENLSSVIISKNGNHILQIDGMHLTGVQAFVNNNSSLTCHFYMEGGVEIEPEYARAGRILLGKES